MSAALYFACDVKFFIAAPDFPPAVAALRAAAPTVDEGWGIYGWGEKVLDASEGLEPREALTAIFDNFGWKLFLIETATLPTCICHVMARRTTSSA